MGKQVRCRKEGCGELFNPRVQRLRHENICTKQLIEKEALVEKTETGSNVCKMCNKIIKHRNNISRHAMVCKPAKQKLKCLECDKEFSFPCKLEHHKLTHTAPIFTCVTCKKHFKRIDYQKHISICSASSTSNQSVNFNEIEDIDFVPSFLTSSSRSPSKSVLKFRSVICIYRNEYAFPCYHSI